MRGNVQRSTHHILPKHQLGHLRIGVGDVLKLVNLPKEGVADVVKLIFTYSKGKRFAKMVNLPTVGVVDS